MQRIPLPLLPHPHAGTEGAWMGPGLACRRAWALMRIKSAEGTTKIKTKQKTSSSYRARQLHRENRLVGPRARRGERVKQNRITRPNTFPARELAPVQRGVERWSNPFSVAGGEGRSRGATLRLPVTSRLCCTCTLCVHVTSRAARAWSPGFGNWHISLNLRFPSSHPSPRLECNFRFSRLVILLFRDARVFCSCSISVV